VEEAGVTAGAQVLHLVVKLLVAVHLQDEKHPLLEEVEARHQALPADAEAQVDPLRNCHSALALLMIIVIRQMSPAIELLKRWKCLFRSVDLAFLLGVVSFKTTTLFYTQNGRDSYIYGGRRITQSSWGKNWLKYSHTLVMEMTEMGF